MKSEKTVVFDDNGDPKELRYYEDGRLSARLGVILDSDKNFIGLRELDIEEVAPPSWLDRLRLRKREPSRISIQTIDFIGLINWINTIKTIKTIENIETIGKIKAILNAEIRPSFILNNSFETGDLSGWYIGYSGYGSVEVTNKKSYDGEYSCKWVCQSPIGSKITEIRQRQCLRSDWLNELRYRVYLDTSTEFECWVLYDDGTSDIFLYLNSGIPIWRTVVISGFTLGKRVDLLIFRPSFNVLNAGKTFYFDLSEWVF